MWRALFFAVMHNLLSWACGTKFVQGFFSWCILFFLQTRFRCSYHCSFRSLEAFGSILDTLSSSTRGKKQLFSPVRLSGGLAGPILACFFWGFISHMCDTLWTATVVVLGIIAQYFVVAVSVKKKKKRKQSPQWLTGLDVFGWTSAKSYSLSPALALWNRIQIRVRGSTLSLLLHCNPFCSFLSLFMLI